MKKNEKKKKINEFCINKYKILALYVSIFFFERKNLINVIFKKFSNEIFLKILFELS